MRIYSELYLVFWNILPCLYHPNMDRQYKFNNWRAPIYTLLLEKCLKYYSQPRVSWQSTFWQSSPVFEEKGYERQRRGICCCSWHSFPLQRPAPSWWHPHLEHSPFWGQPLIEGGANWVWLWSDWPRARHTGSGLIGQEWSQMTGLISQGQGHSNIDITR